MKIFIILCLYLALVMAHGNDTLSKLYLEKLFSKYGRDGQLSLEGLEHLLDSIGLGDFEFDHDTHEHQRGDENFVDFHAHHDHERKSHNSADESHDSHDHRHDSLDHSHDSHDHSHDSHDHSHNSHEDSHDSPDPKVKRSPAPEECLSSESLFVIANGNESTPIDATVFKELCPILIYQLDLHTCRHPEVDAHLHILELEEGADWTAAQKWGYSMLSCFLISLLSLLGAPLIPLMHRVFYNHMLQFMVALAIGTLSADALLHLIPHALTPHDHTSASSHDDESLRLRSVWLGLTSLSGIYLFFLVERVMGVFTTWKRNKKQKVSKESKLEVAEKETGDEASSTHHKREPHSCEGLTLVVHTSKDVRTIANEAHEEVHGHCHTDGQEGFIHSHSNGYHGHSHHGGKVPSSIAAVAWMVIVGDGVHNFSDGLAIGAAFSESMTSGLSTSVAVFCHELPHELGDFAVLLTAGMTVKQALFYNFVSAMLSLLGNIIGVALGNLTNITPWILCLIAGMFLYVALVDMLPELTNMTSKKGEPAVFHLIIQNVGLIVGGSIMLLIAVFEEDIHF